MTGAVSAARPLVESHLTPHHAGPCVISSAPIDAIASRQGLGARTLISGDRSYSCWNFISDAHRSTGADRQGGCRPACCVVVDVAAAASPLWLCHPSLRSWWCGQVRSASLKSCMELGSNTIRAHALHQWTPKLPKIEAILSPSRAFTCLRSLPRPLETWQ